jgi:hypothetical protein
MGGGVLPLVASRPRASARGGGGGTGVRGLNVPANDRTRTTAIVRVYPILRTDGPRCSACGGTAPARRAIFCTMQGQVSIHAVCVSFAFRVSLKCEVWFVLC